MVERYPVGDRDEWLRRRRFAVNASEVGALFGIHPYQSALSLYLEKTGERQVTLADNAVLRRGRIFETAVAEAVRMERPDWRIEKATDYLFEPLTSAEENPLAPLVGIGATPDFLVNCPKRGRGVLQTKVVDPQIYERDWTAQMPPMWIVLQTSQEMMLEGVQWAAIAALVVNPWRWPVHIYEFDAHAPTQAKVRQAITDFWANSIAKRKPPQMDYARDADIIKDLYPEDNGEILDLTGDNYMTDLCHRYEEAEAKVAAAKADEKALEIIKNEIREKLGDALGARLPGWIINNPTIIRKGYVVKETSYRRLTIKHEAE